MKAATASADKVLKYLLCRASPAMQTEVVAMCGAHGTSLETRMAESA